MGAIVKHKDLTVFLRNDEYEILMGSSESRSYKMIASKKEMESIVGIKSFLEYLDSIGRKVSNQPMFLEEDDRDTFLVIHRENKQKGEYIITIKKL